MHQQDSARAYCGLNHRMHKQTSCDKRTSNSTSASRDSAYSSFIPRAQSHSLHNIAVTSHNMHPSSYTNMGSLYDSSSESFLNRACESIRLAQQVHKRELEKKEEMIRSLQNRVEVMQLEHSEYKRVHEDENRVLNAKVQSVAHELYIEQAANERLKAETLRDKEDVSKLLQIRAAQEDKIRQLEHDLDKAHHILKNLLGKNKQSNLPEAANTRPDNGYMQGSYPLSSNFMNTARTVTQTK